MKVLVTGANGFLGSHVVSMLIKKGYQVKAFVLEGTSEQILGGFEYEVYKGDLLNPEDIDKALDSCDDVIHTAAITDMWPSRNDLSWKINHDVVEHLTNAVKRKQIKKYIHVGTANSFGFGTMDNPGTEENEYSCGRYKLDYMDSKKAAQDLLLSEYKKNKLPVVIINPTFMIGENDMKPGTGEMIISVINGRVPGYAAGGRCFAAVKDVARACVNAIDKGKIGECYITGGQNLCYKEFFDLIGKVAGVKSPKLKIPTCLSIAFGGVQEFFALFTKKKPKLTRAMARISGDGHYYTSKKAIKDLNLPQTNIEKALEEAIEWYKNNGYL